MAQFDLTQNIEFEAGQEAQLHIENVEPTDVMTGDRNRKRFLYYQLLKLPTLFGVLNLEKSIP